MGDMPIPVLVLDASDEEGDNNDEERSDESDQEGEIAGNVESVQQLSNGKEEEEELCI